MVKLITDKNCIDLSKLTSLVKLLDKDFNPPLAGRLNIDTWIRKIYERGVTIVLELDGIYIGCLLFYANDQIDRKAYIAYLVVDGNYRRLGLADLMLESCISISKNLGMRSVSVYTNNPGALELYMKNGFTVIGQEVNEGYNAISTFLMRKL